MPDEYDALIDSLDAGPAKKTKVRASLDYRALYQEVGTKYGVDPDLLYKQGKQESVNFEDRYVYGPGKSPAGAAGLAQFMPDTARQYGLNVGKGNDERYNPHRAADAQARMMRDLIAKHGDAKLALAAYNSGHNKTSQQAARAAQRIPETRGYVKKIAPKGDPYDQLLDSMGEDSTKSADPYDQLIDNLGEQVTAPLPKKLDISKVQGGVSAITPPRSNIANVDEILTAARTPQRRPIGPGPRSPWEGVTGSVGPRRPMSMGALLQADEKNVSRLQRISKQVAEDSLRARKQQEYVGDRYGLATADVNPVAANAEALRRFSAEKETESRRRELVNSLTAEDRATIREHAQNMLAMDPVSRGIEKGAQRVGSGLLYKLAAASDLLLGTETEFGKDRPNAPLSAYLKRQAGRGELDIEQIEAEMPPDTKEQWAEFITQMVGSLPELYGATALGGPVGGFAALGGLESMGRGDTTGQVAIETAKGAALGKVFKSAGRLPGIVSQGAAIGGGTVAVEKAFGAEDADALRSAATNLAFHTAMKAPELVSRLTAAAERAYVKPDGPTRQTVPDELQSRLSDIDAIRSQFDAIRNQEAVGAPTPPIRPSLPEVLPKPAGLPTSKLPEGAAPQDTASIPQKVVEAVKPERRAEPRTPEGDLDWATNLAESRGGGIDRDGAGYIVRMGDEAVSVKSISEAVSTARELDTKLGLINPQPRADIVPPPRRSIAELMAERAESGPAPTPNGPEIQDLNTPQRAASLENSRTWYAERLADPTLLDKAVIINDSLSVPVGGVRKMGISDGAMRKDKALQRVKELQGKLGFPDVRIGKPTTVMGEKYYSVEWGKRADLTKISSAETGKLLGYSPEAMAIHEAQGGYPAESGPATETPTITPLVTEAARKAELSSEDRQLLIDSGLRADEVSKGRYDLEKAKTGHAWFDGEYQPITNALLTKAERGRNNSISRVRQNIAKLEKLKAEGVMEVTPKQASEIWGSDAQQKGNIDDLIRRQEYRIEGDQSYYEGLKRQNERTKTAKRGGLRLTRPGEAGFIDIGEIHAAVTKLFDNQLRDHQDVGYELKLPGKNPVRVFVKIDREGKAILSVGKPGDETAGLYTDPSLDVTAPRTDLGTDTILALKHYLLAQHPDIKRVIATRVGSTGGEFGRFVDLDVRARGERRGEAPTVGSVLEHPRSDISGKEIVATTSDGRAIVPNEANKSGISVVKPHDYVAISKELSEYGSKLAQDYRALENHSARRTGLSMANERTAVNYLNSLRRFAKTHNAEKAALVDRAENLYFQGKYADATVLAEQALSGTHDFASKITGAKLTVDRLAQGKPIAASGTDWHKVAAEVQRRVGETGPLSGGGSTFYDVNKYPEGGRPDHAKIAFILEPVIKGIRADARRLIASGKLKAEEFTDYVRREFSKIVSGSDFTDWHPLNRAAALGVVVDTLRKEGPPVGPPPAESATGEPATRARSLPKTIEASGREQIGTDTRYTPIAGDLTAQKVSERINRDGPEATEAWLRDRQPESFAEEAERTEAFIQLSDAYQIKSVEMAGTAPEAAGALYKHAIALTNREFERSTSMGQGIEAYKHLKKYEPASALLEATRLAKKAGITLKPTVAADISTAAVTYQKGVREVKRLKDKVAILEAEAPQPTGASTGGDGPRVRAAGKKRGESILPSKLEVAREQLTEAQSRRRAAKRAVAQRLAAIEQSRSFGGYWKRLMNMNRGLMVSQLSTAMRNLQSQEVRFNIERLTDLVEHGIRTAVGLDSDFTTRGIWRATKRQLDLIDSEIPVLGKGVYTTAHYKAKELLSEHPLELARMFNNYMEAGELPEAGNWRNIESPVMRNIERVFQSGEKAVELVNIFNRVQEFHLRSAEFLAELDLHVRKEQGISLEKFIKQNGMDAIPQELMGKAVDKALEVTFAANPGKDGVGGRLLNDLIQVGNYVPPTISLAAFPRFMFNNAKFLYQYNPTGLIDLARKGQNRPRVLARAMVGTSMLLLAYQFRKSDHAGEKWYEMKFGDYTVDARPFGPFSTYLFFAESVRRLKEGEKAFTVEEIASAFGAATGPGGTGIAVAEKLYDYAANGQWDKWQRVVKTELGDLGRSILTPVRQVKDLIAAFDESQAITRDTSDAPLLGALAESIPYASTNLPPARRPTTTDPIKQEHPVVKQLTGWRIESSKNFLERQLDELHFTSQEIRSNTGIGKLDALEKKLMGPLMDQLGAELEGDENFKSMGKAARADYIHDRILDIRSDVRSMGKAEHPELYDQLKEEKKPQRKKDLEREEQENSPGVSSALRLGVPMPIPTRSANEDDVSYRARLIQLGRQRRVTLDTVAQQPGFFAASPAIQRKQLYSSLNREVI